MIIIGVVVGPGIISLLVKGSLCRIVGHHQWNPSPLPPNPPMVHTQLGFFLALCGNCIHMPCKEFLIEWLKELHMYGHVLNNGIWKMGCTKFLTSLPLGHELAKKIFICLFHILWLRNCNPLHVESLQINFLLARSFFWIMKEVSFINYLTLNQILILKENRIKKCLQIYPLHPAKIRVVVG